jgi:hypothetical protein
MGRGDQASHSKEPRAGQPVLAKGGAQRVGLDRRTSIVAHRSYPVFEERAPLRRVIGKERRKKEFEVKGTRVLRMGACRCP